MAHADGERQPGEDVGIDRPSKQREPVGKAEPTRDPDRAAPGALLENDPPPPHTLPIPFMDRAGHGPYSFPGYGR